MNLDYLHAVVKVEVFSLMMTEYIEIIENQKNHQNLESRLNRFTFFSLAVKPPSPLMVGDGIAFFLARYWHEQLSSYSYLEPPR